MVKTLICGSICDDTWEILVQRLEDLQKSQHGPFEVLFFTSPFQISDDVILSTQSRLEKLEMKLYAFAHQSARERAVLPQCVEILFSGACIFNAHKNLTVAFLLNQPEHEFRKKMTEMETIINGPGYRGCDLLISEQWPKGCEQGLTTGDAAEMMKCNIDASCGSVQSALFASLVRPRYHTVGGLGVFYQRPPYENIQTENAPRLFTRLLSIDQVSTSKEKNKKWLHALSIIPIIYMKLSDIEDTPAEFTISPFAPISGTANKEMEDHPSKRFRHLETDHSSSSSFFFEGGSRTSLNLSAPPDAKTLFIGGLGKETNEQELRKILFNVVAVRRVPGKGYAFVQFSDHASARKVLEGVNRGRGLVLQNRRLSVGWSVEKPQSFDHAVSKQSSETEFDVSMRERLLIPPSDDAKQLFIGNLPHSLNGDAISQRLQENFPGFVRTHSTGKRSFVFAEFDCYESAMALVTRSINETISLDGQPLVVGWAKPMTNSLPPPPSSDCRVLFLGGLAAEVTVKDIENLCQEHIFSVRRPEGRDYAFVEFESAVDAIRCGERLVEENSFLLGNRIRLGWAQGRPADKHEQSDDCWFCLASPSLKAHLIISVGKHNYLAIPRGGVAHKHLIVCPIDCLPNRLQLSEDSKREQQRFCDSAEEMFNSDNCAMLLFERALRTKGSRDHMQLHLVPVPCSMLGNLMTIFDQSREAHGLFFHELAVGESVESAVMTMEGGPFQEFFYVELPVQVEQPKLKRRFVYVHTVGSRFPMFFGNELAARAINRPDRANWKNCILSPEDEKNQVEKIQNDFIPFDFTLSE